MDGGKAGWVDEQSGNAGAVEKTPGGSVREGNGGGSDKGRNREKYKTSLRGGQAILHALYRFKLK